MKNLFLLLFCLLLSTSIYSQINKDFISAFTAAEENPQFTMQAKKLAIERNLPISIFLEDEAFMHPLIVNGDQVIYAVITDFKHPFNNGRLLSLPEIEKLFDLAEATIKYYEPVKKSNYENIISKLAPGDTLFLIPESTGDNVIAYDVKNDTSYLDFITDQGALSTPIEPLYHSIRNSFIISDQLEDLVQEFDTSGVYQNPFAPAGGVNNAILDNIRGMAFHPNGNLLVTVASGSNADAIAEFNVFGDTVGNFIDPNSTIMDSPFDILIRAADLLIPAISSDAVHRYDHSGTYLDDFATSVTFPEQVAELLNGEIALANFSIPNSGIQIYPSDGGAYTQLLNGVDGNRGVAELASGNLLTTNGAGLHEIDRSTGSLVRTLVPGVSARFITAFIVPQNTIFPIFSIHPQSINFGNVNSGTIVSDTLTVSNTGTQDLLIRNVIPDDPSITIVSDTSLIAPNDSAKFAVVLSVPDSGNINANVVFSHNATSSPDTINVLANIVSNNFPFFMVFPTHHDFGTVLADSSKTDTLMVYNTGNELLEISIISSDNPNFVLNPDTGNIAANDSAVFEFTFTAGSVSGSENANIIFIHNALSSPDTVTATANVITSLDRINNIQPKTYNLSQNYPNPFNPITNIKFTLPKSEFVTLTIYNINGQEVETLLKKQLSIGEYNLKFDGSSLPSGIYYYTIKAGNFSKTNKMILIK